MKATNVEIAQVRDLEVEGRQHRVRHLTSANMCSAGADR